MLKRRHLAALVPATLLLAWFVLLRPGFMLDGPADYIIVAGTSMEPALYSGDLAVVRRQQTYAPGDVIAFNVEGGTVIHRVIGGDAAAGYVMQGDNKNAPDLWRPKPENIVGRMWFHVPAAGGWLALAREPFGFGIAAAGLAAIGGVGFGGTRLRRRRRKGGRRMSSHDDSGKNGNGKNGGGGLGGPLPAPWPLLAALGVTAVLAAAFASIAVLAFRQDAERTRFVEQLSYEQTGTFDYTVSMQRSTLYPDGVLRPLDGDAGGADGEDRAATAQPVYTRLAREIALTFDYRLVSDAIAEVTALSAATTSAAPTAASPLTGEVSARLELRAGENGWSRTTELLAPRAFSGDYVSVSLRIDLEELAALIATVEEETGFRAGQYQLSVIPTVNITGELGDETIATVYEPVFAMEYNSTRITLPASLTQSQPASTGGMVTRERQLSVLGVALPVRAWRGIGAGAALAASAVAAALAAIAFLGVGRGADARIRARYHSMLMPVDMNGRSAREQAVRVESMRDLARLAHRDGGIIFLEQNGDGGPRYFVRDGDDIYEYAAGDERPQE